MTLPRTTEPMHLDSPSDPEWDKIPHLFAGELPESEAAALRRWIAEDSDREHIVARMREVWELAAARQQWDAEAELRRIRRDAGSDATDARVAARIGTPASGLIARSTRWTWAIPVAAAVVALAGLELWLREHGAPQARATAESGAYTEFATKRGQRLSLRLSDGTRVTLGPASTLRRPADFGNGHRAVSLTGEAYFDVVHDTLRPFEVRTERTVARDLGTRFVVRAPIGGSPTEVVVVDGRVDVAGRVLAPGERARVTADGHVAVAARVTIDEYVAFINGRLVFRNMPLRDVVRELERWYDVDVALAQAALADRRLTASFSDETIDDVLQKIAAPLGITASHNIHGYLITDAR